MRYLSLIPLALIALLGVSFAILNAMPVHFDYYLGTAEVPLSLLMVGALILGAIIGMLTVLPTVVRQKFENRRLRSAVFNQTQIK